MHRLNMVLLLVPWALTAVPAPAYAEASAVTEIGRWAHSGSFFGFALNGARGYLPDGCYLQTLDLSDLDHPVLDRELLFPDIVMDLASRGNHAYVAAYRAGLHIVDVSDPAQPVVGQIGGTIVQVELSGNVAFLTDPATGLISVDITDPMNPSAIDSLPLSDAKDVTVQGTVAYVLSGGGLHSIDVSNPAAMSELDFVPFVFTPGIEADERALVVEGSYAYVTNANGLRIVEISDPTGLDPRGLYPFEFIGTGFGVHGGYAYVTDWDYLLLIDVTNPDNPVLYRSYDLGRHGHHVGTIVFEGNTAYFVDSHWGLSILDVTNPGSITERSLFETTGAFFGVASKPGLVAAATSNHFRLFDVSDPQNPALLASVEQDDQTDGDLVSMTFEGDDLYACFEQGLKIIDVSDPSAPIVRPLLMFGAPALDMACRMGRAAEPDLVAVSVGGEILVIDVTDPDVPDLLGAIDLTPYSADQITADGDHLYVSTAGGVFVYTLGTPLDPPSMLWCGAVGLPLPASEIVELVVDGTHGLLYRAERDGAIRIIDVSNPCAPGYLGTHVVPAEVMDLAVATSVGNTPLLQVLSRVDFMESALTTFDASDPSSLQEVGAFTDLMMAEDMARAGQDIVVAAIAYGFWLLRDNAVVTVPRVGGILPLRFAVSQSAPNPFARRTVIELALPQGGPAKLVVHDVAGRRVRTLVDQVLEAGVHHVAWDGVDDNGARLPAGVYFYAATAGGDRLTKRMILVGR